MPLYEFQCTECGEVVELLLKLKARPPKCEECGGRLSKKVSAPAFQFKGSGWYVTDYAGKSKTSEASSGDDASGGAAADADKGAQDASAGKKDATASSESGTGSSSGSKEPKKGSGAKPASTKKSSAKAG